MRKRAKQWLSGLLVLVALIGSVAATGITVRAGSEDKPEVGDVFSVSGHITSWTSASVSYGTIQFTSGILSGITASATCKTPTAADPEIGHGYSGTFTVTGIDKKTGEVSGSFSMDSNVQKPGGVDASGHVTGYQSVGGITGIIRHYTGHGALMKVSADRKITDGNKCYSLKGAEYGVYETYEDAQSARSEVGRLITDATGNSNQLELDERTYYVKEIKASPGYYLDKEIHDITVTAGEVAALSVEEYPGNDPVGIEIVKIDRETGESSPIEAASLEGAKFRVRYYDGYFSEKDLPEYASYTSTAKREWIIQTLKHEVEGETIYYARLDEKHKVSGDDFYYTGNNPNPTLPLGTITVEEIEAPEGYLLTPHTLKTKDNRVSVKDGVYVGQVKLKGSNLSQLVGGNYYQVEEQVKRGDISFIKIDKETQDRMAGIPFLITAKKTGEKHIVVTDENGYYDSQSSFYPHQSNTNANDTEGAVYTSQCGLWFGTNQNGTVAAADNSLGALPYGEYSIKELQCEANKGKSLIEFSVTIRRDRYRVELGTKSNSDARLITHATVQSTGTQTSRRESNVTVVDEIEYFGLKKGQTYRIETALMNGDTGEEILDADHNPVRAVKHFKAEYIEGITRADIVFDATLTDASKVVVFERIFDEKENLIAVHEDLESEEQSIFFAELKTTALDADTKDHISCADEEIRIIDTVAYKGLRPGEQYRVSGTLMDKETKEPLVQKNGNLVEASTEFVAEEQEGTVEVEFVFNGVDLAGKTIVAFEELYHDDKKIAIHANLEAEEQTVYIPEIGTTASDKSDGDKELRADAKAVIIDRIEYKNLIPGTYRIVGRLMDQQTGKALEIDKKEFTVEKIFVAEAANGSVEVEFAIDATKLAGKKVVVFEKLFMEKVSHENPENESKEYIEVAFHEDIKDEGQTVTFIDKPETPENPPVNPPVNPPKTGVRLYGAYYILAGMALLLIVGIASKQRKKK